MLNFATNETITLNIFVCIKQVPGIRSDIIPNDEANYIDTTKLRWIISPEDDCAVEQALQIREQFPDSSITALRVGMEKHSEPLIDAMAMGADDSILVLAKEELLDPYMTAKAIKAAIERSGKKPDIILCGNGSIDNESCQVPQILAQMFCFPCVTRVIDVCMNNREPELKRQIEDGKIETYWTNLPIVVACKDGLNVPRYAPLPFIEQAKQKPMLKLSLDETGVNTNDQRLRYSNFRLPQTKQADKSIYNYSLSNLVEAVLTQLSLFLPNKKSRKIFNASNRNDVDNVVTEVIEILRADIKSLQRD